MHLAHEVVHLVQCGLLGADDHVDALTELVELEVGHQGGHLDECVVLERQPGHLAVDPDDPVGQGLVGGSATHPPHCSHLTWTASLQP